MNDALAGTDVPGPTPQTAALRAAPRRRGRSRATARVLALCIAVVGVAVSVVAWQGMAQRERARADQDFARYAALATSHIERRVQHVQDLLVAVAAPFAAAQEPSRADFHRLIVGLRLPERLPEIRAVQWSRLVAEPARAAFEQHVRSDRSVQPAGYPEFRIHPPGPRASYVAVEFNEPMAGNERAFGHDNTAEPSRREQVERARDSGLPMASPPLRLVQGDLGWILRVPVFHAGWPLATPEQRRAAFKGQVSGVLRADILLRDVADADNAVEPDAAERAGATEEAYDLVVRDLGHTEPDPNAAVTLPVELAALRQTAAPRPAAAAGLAPAAPAGAALRDRHSKLIEVAGRIWAIEVQRAPTNHALQPAPLAVLVGGCLMALLVAAALWRQAERLARAGALAERLSARARAAAQRLDAIIEHTADGIVTLDLEGTVVGANRAAQTMFGLPRTQIEGRALAQFVPMLLERARPDDPLAGLRASAAAGSERTLAGRRETSARRADGTPFPVELKIAPVHMARGTQLVCSLRDLTELKAADEAVAATMGELHRATALQQAMLRHAAFAIVLLDRAGTVRAINPAAEALLGIAAEAVLNRESFARFFDAAEMARLLADRASQRGSPGAGRAAPRAGNGVDYLVASVQGADAAGAARHSAEHELHLVRQDGVRVPVSLAVTALRDAAGEVTQLLLIAYDATARRQMVAEMTQLAYTDRLTGLANRAEFERALSRTLAEARHRERPLALLFIDLDRFKPINDNHGHAVGDKVLGVVARRLTAAVRASDLVARLGGDEFVVLLTSLHSNADCAAVAEKILQSVSEVMQLDGLRLEVGASIGIVTGPEGGDTAEALLARADAAMYEAKQAGRNCFKLAEAGSPQMQ